MVPEQAWAALSFGILSAVSLVIGAAIGVVWRPPQRAVAAIMAFGAGALLSALAFELVLSAQERGGFRPVAIGGLIGGISFVVINELLNSQGGFLRKRATTEQYLHDHRREDVMALLSKLSGGKFLRSLPPEEIHAILPHVQTVRYEKGAPIFEEGSTCDALYIVEDGEVELRASKNRQTAERHEQSHTGRGADISTLNRLGPGDAFGEISLLTGEPHSATAVCNNNVTAWRIPSDKFHQLLAGSPALSKAVSKLLQERLQSSDAQQAEKQMDAERWRKIACRYVEAHASAPTPDEMIKAARQHAGSAPMGIFLGLLLDGIPESLVIGMGMIGKPTISGALIFGLFLSNLPEAMSSAVGMKAQGTPAVRILTMWTLLMFLIGAGAFLGNALFVGAPVLLIAAFEAAAAGAMLAMIAETALPEAYEQGGWLSGLATLLGFLSAFFVGTLGEGH